MSPSFRFLKYTGSTKRPQTAHVRRKGTSLSQLTWHASEGHFIPALQACLPYFSVYAYFFLYKINNSKFNILISMKKLSPVLYMLVLTECP